MKKFICLALLLSVFVFTSTVAAYEPEVPPYDPPAVPVHPTLLANYEAFFPPTVITVTDGVYVARGYNRDNPTLIEGADGLIVVDPGRALLRARPPGMPSMPNWTTSSTRNRSRRSSTPTITTATSTAPPPLPASRPRSSATKT